MSEPYDFDFYVIGAGSAGVRAARMAGGFGARVGVAEKGALGGTCVNVGCVPKKLFVYASDFAHRFEDAAGYGWSVSPPRFDWPTLVRNKDREIGRLNAVYERLLTNTGCQIHEGWARLVDPHTVQVGDQRYTAKHILVATGGKPRRPEIPGCEHTITSDEIFFLDNFPERLLILGGGYIGVEFAGIFAGLGAQVTQIYRGELFLRGFDQDVREHLATEMRRGRVDLRFETNITRIDKQDSGLRVTLTDGSTMEVDQVLCATGRVPNTAGMGLEAIGVELGPRGGVRVDDEFRSSVPSVFACGDVIDHIALTPVALAEGMCIARTLFAGADYRVDYRDIPTAVFSQPNIGTVGLTEGEARVDYGDDVVIYRSNFRSMYHVMAGREDRVFMKLVVDGRSDRVVGCHMVGADAGEIIQGLAVAMKCGATKAQFDRTIGIHPTAAEEFVTMRTPAS